MKKFKYAIGLFIFTIIFLFNLCTFSFATTGIVNTDTLRIRKEAATDSTVIDLLSLNQEVEIIETSGDWYKIKYNEYTGYVSKEFITVKEDSKNIETTNTENNNNENTVGSITEGNVTTENTITDSNTTGETNSATECVANNTTNAMNQEITNIGKEVAIIEDTYIKILPLITSNTIYNVNKGDKYTVVNVAGVWSYISSDTTEGWVLTSKISSDICVINAALQNSAKENTSVYTKKTGYINATSVNLRSQPSKDSTVLKKASINTAVEIVGENGDWYQISIDNVTAYVLKSYVSDSKTQTTSRSTELEREASTITEQNVQQDNTSTSNELVTTSTCTTGDSIVAYAKQYYGYPYVYGTAGPNTFDCSGFTSYVYKHFGYTISRSSKAQATEGVEISKENLQPGDILIFLNTARTAIGHVGIYIGNNQFIHASCAKVGVTISNLDSASYTARYVTARRII